MANDENVTDEKFVKLQQELDKTMIATHINNMGGVAINKSTEKVQNSSQNRLLLDISKKQRKSRLLIDLFACSISPIISRNGWRKVSLKTVDEDWNETSKIERRPKGKLEYLLIDDFLAFFFEKTNEYFNCDIEKYEELGGGDGFNAGRKYQLGNTSSYIQFRFFDPKKATADKYQSGSAVDNYFRQKINIKLTGDGLQTLREQKVLNDFFVRLYQVFEPTVTMFDLTLDMFNYVFLPKYFGDLYVENKYSGRSRVNSFGDMNNPTIYIGEYKSARTIMMYDKMTEAIDKNKSDEPDLLEALKKNNGSWFRLEQHYARDNKEAEQVFDSLMDGIYDDPTKLSNVDGLIQKRMAEMLRLNVENKCRFLSKVKPDININRVPNDKKWNLILKTISETKSDFAFVRPELTLEEKKYNFIHLNMGGKKLFNLVVEKEGESSLRKLFSDAVEANIEQINNNAEYDFN